jgi:hypothetical protein
VLTDMVIEVRQFLLESKSHRGDFLAAPPSVSHNWQGALLGNKAR